MANYLGDIVAAQILYTKFTTVAASTGAPTTLSGSPALSIYKDDGDTESTSGITLTVDADSRTGMNKVKIDTSSDGTFYAAGHDFQLVITTGTVGGTSAVGYVVAEFSIANRPVNITRILGTAISTPATAGVMDVNVKNMNNVAATSITTVNANQGTTQPINFTGTAGSALVKGDTVDIAGAAVSATTAQVGVNVVNWNNTVVATPATAGIPDINLKNIANAAVSTSTAQLGVNAVNWGGGAIPAPAVTGVPVVDLKYILGTLLTETAGQIAAGFKQFFNIASPTSTMNLITAVTTTTTATTATNLTNAPTNGDFTAAMKTSLNAATPASVVGAVGSVTGNVGGNVNGNVIGSVASVIADVGITQGAADKVFGASGAAMAELTGVPSATPSPRNALMVLFMALRNKLTTDATTKTIFNDANAAIGAKTLSDSGTVYTEDKMA